MNYLKTPPLLSRKRKLEDKVIANHDPKLPSLSPDIIHEVLLRLPIKSILKFRCTSKLLNEVSTTPEFISAHTRCFRDNSHLPASLALYRTHGPRVVLLRSAKRTNLVTTKKTSIEFMTKKPYLPTKQIVDIDHLDYLRATCDGLLCFEKWGRGFVILNPLTRDCSIVSLSEYEGKYVESLGFYYHASSGQYRLLVKFRREVKFSIVTLGPNTVRTIENTCHHIPHPNGEYIFLKDTLYFFGEHNDFDIGTSLVAFDVEAEQFTVLPVPGYTYDDRYSNLDQLVVIEGKLCVCSIRYDTDEDYNLSNLRVELWVLVDREAGEWIKKKHVNVKTIRRREDRYNFVCSTSTKYDEFLLVKSGNIDIASPDKILNLYSLDRLKVGSMFDEGLKVISCVKMYRETLVAIDKLQFTP